MTTVGEIVDQTLAVRDNNLLHLHYRRQNGTVYHKEPDIDSNIVKAIKARGDVQCQADGTDLPGGTKPFNGVVPQKEEK